MYYPDPMSCHPSDQEEASSLLAKSKALLNEDRIPSIPKRSPLAPRTSSGRSSPSPRSSSARRTCIDEIPISSNGASHSNVFQRPYSMPLAQRRGLPLFHALTLVARSRFLSRTHLNVCSMNAGSIDGRGAVDMHFVERGDLVGLPRSSFAKSLVEEVRRPHEFPMIPTCALVLTLRHHNHVMQVEEVSLPRFSAYSKSRCRAATDTGSCGDESVPAGRHLLSSALDRVPLPAKRFDYLPGTATWGFEVNLSSTKMPPGKSSTRAWLNDARPASYPQHQRPARDTAATAEGADELIRRIHGIGAPTGLRVFWQLCPYRLDLLSSIMLMTPHVWDQNVRNPTSAGQICLV